MREFRIGAPKAGELRSMLIEEKAREIAAREFAAEPPNAWSADVQDVDEPPADPWQYAEPLGPDPAPAEPDPVADPVDIPLDGGSAPADEPDRAATLRAAMAVRGALLEPRPDPADTQVRPAVEADPAADTAPAGVETDAQPTPVGHPDTTSPAKRVRPVAVWPIIILALPAFVAVWSGWVGLGGLTGFGVVHPLPGIWDSLAINTAITLPIGVETYGAYALFVWLSGRMPDRARRFAKWSAIGSLLVGALGQVAYHLLVAAGIDSAPWWITTAVSVLPVAVLGMGAALAHLVREGH
ncbi:ABC transporter permease [Micromonospora qiuiae]